MDPVLLITLARSCTEFEDRRMILPPAKLDFSQSIACEQVLQARMGRKESGKKEEEVGEGKLSQAHLWEPARRLLKVAFTFEF